MYREEYKVNTQPAAELWQPGLSPQRLRDRATVMASIRSFFAARRVLEVETPLLASAGVTDPHLTNATTTLNGQGSSLFYLQTSPEYAMKRLLAAGSGCIFQLARVVRDDEVGRFHNPEFTMLEWYRVGFDEHQLMDEVDQLLQELLQCAEAERLTYQQAFLRYLKLDPLTDVGLTQLRSWLVNQDIGDWIAEEPDTDILLHLAMSHYIEPELGQEKPCFIYNFPASQAALAQIDSKDQRVARRFEVYFKGIELANGFYELTDADAQAARFDADNHQRELMGRPPAVVDTRLLGALRAGLPDCAGVALGVDRLLMLKWKAKHIDEVQSFSSQRS